MGQVTLNMDEYQTLLNRALEAEKMRDLATIELRSVKAETFDPTGHVRKTVEAAREVARFAVAHLSPECYRAWPAAHLRVLADCIENAPGASADYLEMAIDFRAFAREAEKFDAQRAIRDAAPKAVPAVVTEPPAPPTIVKQPSA